MDEHKPITRGGMILWGILLFLLLLIAYLSSRVIV